MRLQETRDRLRAHTNQASWMTRLLARWAIEAHEAEAKCILAELLHRQAHWRARLCTRLTELGEKRGGDVGECPPRIRAAACVAVDGPVAIGHLLPGLLADCVAEARAHAEAARVISDDPTRRLLRGWTAAIEADLAELRAWCAAAPAIFVADAPAWTRLDAYDPPSDLLAERLPQLPPRDRRLMRSAPEAQAMEPGLPPREAALRFLHHNITDLEIPTIEACCRLILLHGDRMPWSFTEDMSRQAWDEARHTLAFLGRLHELGGELGQYAHGHDLWRMATDQPLDLCLALHQRIGEWIGVDGGLWNAARLRAAGDAETAELLDYVVADEITHVAIGNRWLRYLLPDLAAVDAVHSAAERRRAAFGKVEEGPMVFPFNRWACERAGFLPAEVDALEARWRRFGSRVEPVPMPLELAQPAASSR